MSRQPANSAAPDTLLETAALWFERNASRLGRAGWQHIRSAGAGQGFRHYFDEQQERMRDRFRHED